MEPVKTHLPYDEQLGRMVGRGLTYASRQSAMLSLKRIGYYRLSAYTYPFRAFADEPHPAAEPGTLSEFKPRSAQFLPGSNLEDALKLYALDEKLRLILMEGLNTIEVGLAVRIAYVLGKRGALAHMNASDLNEPVCRRPSRPEPNGDVLTEHEAWMKRYSKLKRDASQEEYVKHHILRYGGNVPVWVATEFLDFGCLVRLLSLMKEEDQRKVSSELGLHNDRAGTLYRWLKALNILRNHCAHNNRIWNRSTVDVPPKFSPAIVDERLHHVNALDNAKRQKLYQLAAVVAYLLTEINPDTNWPRSFRTAASKFGEVQGMTVENSMGFPPEWHVLPLWNYAPIQRP